MMDNHIQFLQNLYDDAVEEDINFKYHIPFEENEYCKIFNESTWPILEDPKQPIDALGFKSVYELFELHFEYGMFAKTKLNDNVIATEHLTKASAYGVFVIHYGVLSSSYIPSPKPFVPMNKALLILSLCIILNQKKNAELVGKHLIDSLNSVSSIMKRGQPNAHIAWFIAGLYIQHNEKKLDINKAFKPKDFDLFQEVLNNWDTQDQRKLEKYVLLLADNHIAQARISSATNLDNLENNAFDFSELFLPSLYLLPYEILVWFKLRQQRGLVVPVDVDHPLLRMASTKEFLDNTAELSMPINLPFIQTLVKNIKQQCSPI
ncbi:hypothetical protein [Agarilytica rhodophyticola]|uniref:hypothetical protein n=1 Tax=Agarilytica rhodophyticola TaxID=1737490 RepID=UPI0013158ABB|nr:hypothetical protein [Agarilytica rhodophyticola]